ncbi:MAG: HEAT repeat domain-containing protein [Ignavibacteriales bacterium]|nr:HEAT repeat domain-containing protein [Ignavibacteriales bacterium]
MNNNHVKESLLEYINRNLDSQTEKSVRQHLASCEACKKECDSLSNWWTALEQLPNEKPSEAVREKFYQVLQEEIEATQQLKAYGYQKPKRSWLELFFPQQIAGRFAFALVILVLGGLIGYMMKQEPKSMPIENRTEITQLHEEVIMMNRLLTVSLLQQQSASERLKGVSLSYRSEGSDPEITAALLQALKYDPNVNVRLSALDALSRNLNQTDVKQELLETLPKQESPLVQLAFIDLMVQIREKSSVDILKRMLKNPEMNKSVKQRIEQGIQELNS